MQPSPQDVDALLALSEPEIDALPPEVAEAARELINQRREAAEREERERQARIRSLGLKVVGEYYDRLSRRREIETRWAKDVRRYNGQYEPLQERALEAREFGSRAFVPLTRRVCDIVEARMADLLFQTNERGFVVRTSPSPELSRIEMLASGLPPGQVIQTPMGTLKAGAISSAIREIREEAKSKSDAMQREIDDQFMEGDFQAIGRRVLHDGLMIGTGVMKGPIPTTVTERQTINGQLVIREVVKPRPVYVNVWNWFPDMSASSLDESESEIERHYLTTSQFASLARQPGFEGAADHIRRILQTPPASRVDFAIEEMRQRAGAASAADPRYLVLERHGSISRQDLIDAGIEIPDDELVVFEGCLWVYEADGTILKAALSVMPKQQRVYSAYCWRKDPSCIFGYGLAYEVEHPQDGANATWRAAIDNSGLSVGGMVAINDKLVRPEDGRWTIEPRKVWRGMKGEADMRAAFHFVEIPNNLQPLLALFDRSKQLIDDIGGPSMAMQGQEAPSYLDTARGASIAMNAANIWFRRGVSYWDDDITTPMVNRFVDFNMEYSDNEAIKGGDWDVIARGRSALLEQEGMIAKLQLWQQVSAGTPLPYRFRIAGLKEVARALRLDPDDHLPDDAEIKKIAERVDNQPPQPNPEVERIKLREQEIKENGVQRQHEMEIEILRAQVRLAEIADRNQITIEEARKRFGLEELKINAQLQDNREQRAHDAQAMNAELAIKAQKGSGI